MTNRWREVARLRGTAHPVLSLAIGIGTVTTGAVVSLFGPIVAAAPFVVVAAGWIWLRMPGILLGAYVFLPFYKAAVGSLSPVDLTPLLAAANASQVALLLVSRERMRGSRFGLTLWVAFGVVVLAAVLWAGQQTLAVDRASFWWILILLPSIAAVRVASKPRFVAQFLATGFVVGCLIIVLGLPGLFGFARLAVIGENTLQTGAITLIVAILSILWVVRGASPWVRPLIAILIVVGLAESIASGSRGPVLAFVLVLGYAFSRRMLSGRRLTGHDLGMAALATIAVVVLALAIDRLPGQSIARLLQFGEAVSSGGPFGSSIQARENLFSIAVNMFVDRPILGNGTGAFAAYTTTHAGLTEFTYPHNDLLQIAAEFGIVGAGLFVSLVAVALLRRIPADPLWISVKGLVIFMLALSFTSGDIYGDRLMWSLFVLLLSAPLAYQAAAPTIAWRERRSTPATAPEVGTTATRVTLLS